MNKRKNDAGMILHVFLSHLGLVFTLCDITVSISVILHPVFVNNLVKNCTSSCKSRTKKNQHLERIYLTTAMELIHVQKWKSLMVLIVEESLEKLWEFVIIIKSLVREEIATLSIRD